MRGAAAACRVLALFMTALVAGCGFRPLHGDLPGSVSSEDLAEIQIGLIPDRSGQLLRNRLLARMRPFGPAETITHVLDVELSESAIGLAVRRDETATRTNLTITATVVLTEIDTDEIVLVDSVRSYASYDILNAEYATLSAERDARERAINDLGDRIASRVSLYLIRPE